MARIRINTRTHTKTKPYLINSYFFFKIVKAKKSIGWAKYVYVSEICAEGILVTFRWWLKNVKSRSKIALSWNERHFEIWFPKNRTITFFWSKLSKLHKKDPILHVATTFSLKQGETRTSHGPIPHPLRTSLTVFYWSWWISSCRSLSIFPAKGRWHKKFQRIFVIMIHTSDKIASLLNIWFILFR